MINDITVTENLNELSESQLMELTGQGAGPSTNNNEGLARLNINYTEEDDEGKTLPRGDWKIMSDGRFVYAPTIKMRPFLRTYTYSIWDDEESKFSSQSIQAKSLGERFIDTDGTEKCGRLSKEDEAKLPETDPRVLLSRSVVCNQVIYGTVSGDFLDADGANVRVDELPFVSYFKRSGWRPVKEAIDNLTRQKKTMLKTTFDVSTKKNKMGTVIFWTPTFAQVGYKESLEQEDLELLKKFTEVVGVYNNGIQEKYRQNFKPEDDESVDIDLELADVSAA